MFDLLDPETMWLNITNGVLGLVTVVCVAVVAYVAVKEILARSAARARIPVEADTHVFQLEDLGITMADGGEKIDESRLPDSDPPNVTRSEN